MKFIAADPATGDIAIAAQIAAQTLGPEFKDWLNEPQKLLQLIAAAEGAQSGGGGPGGAPFGSVPNPVPGETAGNGSGNGAGGGSGTGTGNGNWAGGVVPLQEEEVMQAIRLLTRFGEAGSDPDSSPEISAAGTEPEPTRIPESICSNCSKFLAANAPPRKPIRLC